MNHKRKSLIIEFHVHKKQLLLLIAVAHFPSCTLFLVVFAASKL